MFKAVMTTFGVGIGVAFIIGMMQRALLTVQYL